MNPLLSASSTGERRIDLDWVRIIAFALLIWYHVTCFYAAITPHNQPLSPRTYGWLIVPMLALNPWRLLILFTVSGAATRFMADKMRPVALFRTRSARLLPPLLFVTAVIVPPIAFVTAEQWFGYQGSFIAFLGQYFTADNHFCQAGHCMPVPRPNYAHLWFVCYLWIYTVLLVGLLAWAPRALSALQRGLERASRGWGLILWPVAYLGLARFALEGRFPQTLDLIHDWYNHVIFLGGFLFGFSIAKSDAIWTALERIRARTLSGALVSYATIIILGMIVLGPDFNRAPKVAPGPQLELLRALGGMVWGFDQWLWITAAFGFARRYLSQRDGSVRRYLTDAIFPFYIIHELTITVGGYYLTRFGLDVRLEFAFLVTATALSCFITYEIARRIAWLRPLFGLKTLPAGAVWTTGLEPATAGITIRGSAN